MWINPSGPWQVEVYDRCCKAEFVGISLTCVLSIELSFQYTLAPGWCFWSISVNVVHICGVPYPSGSMMSAAKRRLWDFPWHVALPRQMLPLPLDLLRTLSHFHWISPTSNSITFLGNIGSNISVFWSSHSSIYCHIFPRGVPSPDASLLHLVTFHPSRFFSN